MKSKSILLSGILIVAPIALLLFTCQERVFGQDARVQANRRTLPNQGALSKMRVDDKLTATVGLRPDLTIKKMCLLPLPQYPTFGNWLNVQIANIGSSDAGFFELGITYTYANGNEIFEIDPVYGLKAGEEIWLWFNNLDWSFTPIVEASVKFQVIADPRFYKWNGTGFKGDPKNYSWTPPRILESNEKNNELTINKSELKVCPVVSVQHPTQPPQVKPKKP